jgi:hypothetical protein
VGIQQRVLQIQLLQVMKSADGITTAMYARNWSGYSGHHYFYTKLVLGLLYTAWIPMRLFASTNEVGDGLCWLSVYIIGRIVYI